MVQIATSISTEANLSTILKKKKKNKPNFKRAYRIRE